jgi:transposase
MFTGTYRLSKRSTTQVLHDLFGVKVALGSIVNLERRTSEALADPVAELREHVKEAEIVHADETGWRQRRKKAWLWVAVTAFSAVFLIRRSRGRKVAKELLGEEPGIVVSDRYSAYGWLPVLDRQACWSHLKRDFQKIADAGGDAAPVGEALLACERKLFSWWHRVREGTLKRASFRTYVSRLRVTIRKLLIEGTVLSDEKSAGMCEQILKVESALYTFARVEGVEPTNNRAETSLRHSVIWRKTSFGTHSRAGSDFVERILTVVGTLRIQGRNVLEYLTEACRAALNGDSAPSLVSPSDHRVTSVA